MYIFFCDKPPIFEVWLGSYVESGPYVGTAEAKPVQWQDEPTRHKTYFLCDASVGVVADNSKQATS